MSYKIIGIMSIATLACAGFACSHAPLSSSFNEENASNIAVQTVNSNVGKDDAETITLDGQKSERLLQRYRSDTGKVTREGLVTGSGMSTGTNPGQKY